MINIYQLLSTFNQQASIVEALAKPTWLPFVAPKLAQGGARLLACSPLP